MVMTLLGVEPLPTVWTVPGHSRAPQLRETVLSNLHNHSHCVIVDAILDMCAAMRQAVDYMNPTVTPPKQPCCHKLQFVQTDV